MGLATGHWPQFTKPRDLTSVILTAASCEDLPEQVLHLLVDELRRAHGHPAGHAVHHRRVLAYRDAVGVALHGLDDDARRLWRRQQLNLMGRASLPTKLRLSSRP